MFVETAGNSSSPTTYRHSTSDLEPGVWSFRLKQIDYDGKFEYGPVVVTSSAQYVKLELFDMLGRRVRSLFDREALAGRAETVNIDVTDLPAGLYFFRLVGDSGGQEAHREVVIQ